MAPRFPQARADPKIDTGCVPTGADLALTYLQAFLVSRGRISGDNARHNCGDHGAGRADHARTLRAVPVVSAMSTGATDSRFFRALGLPAYGVSGLFSDPTVDDQAHGRDERMSVQSYYDGQEFL